jgi:transketolase
VRDIFCKSLVKEAGRPEFVFLTGDLGFKALEPLRDAMGTRFINAGVAEQNMVSVAGGMAKTGLRPWVYSIAPFVYARPFEQIRNDICLPSFPAVLVGNGGGYGYGVMGSTHHALEDYGALLTLPGMRASVPAFDEDVAEMVTHLIETPSPAYLRLGVSELPKNFDLPEYAPWRRLTDGGGPTVVVVGPLVGGILNAVAALPPARRPALWVLTELPIDDLPAQLLDDVARTQRLIVVEEHVAQGGAGQMLAYQMMAKGRAARSFVHCHARGYVSGLYGSQAFHRQESGIDAATVLSLL